MQTLFDISKRERLDLSYIYTAEDIASWEEPAEFTELADRTQDIPALRDSVQAIRTLRPTVPKTRPPPKKKPRVR